MNRALRLYRILAPLALCFSGLTGSISDLNASDSSPLAYEGFDYPAGKQLAGLEGGSGFSDEWILNPTGRLLKDLRPTIIAASLEYSGLKTSGGACRILRSDDALVRSERTLSVAVAPGARGQTLYLAFLVKPEGVLGEGVLNGYFCVGLDGSHGNVFAGKPGGDRMDRYVIEEQGGNGQVASDVAPAINQTALIVLKVELREGPDPVTLYVNPKVGSEAPAKGVTKSDTDLGTLSQVVLYSSGAHILDELRVGRTFADVVPAAGPRK